MNTLFRFIARAYYVLLFIALEAIAFVLISKNNDYQSTRISRVATEMSGAMNARYNALTDYFHLAENNDALAAENAMLRQKLKESFMPFDSTKHAVNDTFYLQRYQYVDAKIISNTTSARNNYLMINKGADLGIKPGMAVIAPNGVVGIVKVVSPHFSSVISVLNSESRVSAKIKRGGFAGSLVWNGVNYRYGTLIDVPSHFDVKEGDTVVTSGYSLNFPEGIMIGIVRKINTTEGDNFHALKIQLSTDFKKVDNVYVVKNLFREEQDKLQTLQAIDE